MKNIILMGLLLVFCNIQVAKAQDVVSESRVSKTTRSATVNPDKEKNRADIKKRRAQNKKRTEKTRKELKKRVASTVNQ